MSGLPRPIQGDVFDLSRPSWHWTGLFEELPLLDYLCSPHLIWQVRPASGPVCQGSIFGEHQEVSLIEQSHLPLQLN